VPPPRVSRHQQHAQAAEAAHDAIDGFTVARLEVIEAQTHAAWLLLGAPGLHPGDHADDIDGRLVGHREAHRDLGADRQLLLGLHKHAALGQVGRVRDQERPGIAELDLEGQGDALVFAIGQDLLSLPRAGRQFRVEVSSLSSKRSRSSRLA
jgi:hypothetical protein